jgi:hypothetical protein
MSTSEEISSSHEGFGKSVTNDQSGLLTQDLLGQTQFKLVGLDSSIGALTKPIDC